ncbi:MAG: DNA polymerase III subunit gamma/tau [Candidatus Rokubacteria bacterium]|nr:DNA polymerase III subunit gamma/tau [Candidatus Rokubacteria bacterium]
MSYQVLARRWRPLTFEAVVGQGPIVRTLQNALARQRIAHAYLFTGPRGVGKTTTARLLAMGLNCDRAGAGGAVPCAACDPCREIIAGRALDVIEIDGASNRGIDEVRTLRENVRYAPARARRKVYIIDEVHMLTEPAFNALLKTLEEPPPHVVFILATTEPREVPATILSRCQRFDFRPIASGEIAAGLARILGEEATRTGETLSVEPEALGLIASAAEGSLRDALSLLDTALAYGEGRVAAQTVRELLGSGGAEAPWALASALARRDAGAALGRIDRAAAEGLDVGLLCQDAMELLRRALLVTVHGEAPRGVTADEAERLRQLGAAGTEDLLLLVKGLLDAEVEMRKSPHPRVDLEVAVVRLCQRPDAQAI